MDNGGGARGGRKILLARLEIIGETKLGLADMESKS